MKELIDDNYPSVVCEKITKKFMDADTILAVRYIIQNEFKEVRCLTIYLPMVLTKFF